MTDLGVVAIIPLFASRDLLLSGYVNTMRTMIALIRSLLW